MEYQRDEHRVHLIVYHLVWTPKRQKAVLTSALAADCRHLIEQKCAEQGWVNVELAIQPDHVHLFVRVRPSTSAAEVVRHVKGVTSRELRQKYPSVLKLDALLLCCYCRHLISSEHRGVHRGSEGALMRKTFKYRLYPSRNQERLLCRTLDSCRFLYNHCLAQRREAWEQKRRSVGKFAQLAQVKDYRQQNPDASQVHSHVLQVVVADLDKAFQAFFRRVKAGQTAGYPRFKSRDRFHSFGFKEYGNGFRVDGRRLKLSGIGRVAVRWHRPVEGTIKTVRIVRRAGKWYACFACEVDAQPPLPASGQSVGLDVGLTSLLTTSEGEKIENPRWYRHAQQQLRVAQRRVARRKKGSQRRRKAVLTLQRAHEYVRNSRQDFLNKLVARLIGRYDLIAVEELQINNMVRNRHLAKSILDAGWGYFRQRLSDKAAEAGRIVVAVDPAYTSKSCSGCGRRFDALTLADRWVACACGLSLDRDHNAALNVLYRAGQVRQAPTYPAGDCVA